MNSIDNLKKKLRSTGRTIAIFTLMFFGAIALTGGVLWMWMQFETLDIIGARLDAGRPWFIAWHGLLFAVVIAGWPYWINALAQKQEWDEIRRDLALRARWPIAIWWIIVELAVVQNGVGRALERLSWS